MVVGGLTRLEECRCFWAGVRAQQKRLLVCVTQNDRVELSQCFHIERFLGPFPC